MDKFLKFCAASWQYFKYVVRHKYHVARYCFHLGLYWRGITHDLSKFAPDEWGPYLRRFYLNDDSPAALGCFVAACERHYKRNDHHPEHHEILSCDLMKHVVYMPEVAVKEMVADWFGAAEAQGKHPSTVVNWYYSDNYDRWNFVDDTRKKIMRYVSILYWEKASRARSI